MFYTSLKTMIPLPPCPACKAGLPTFRMVKNSTVRKERGDILVYPDGPYWVTECVPLPTGAYDVSLTKLNDNELVVYGIMES